MAKTWEETVIHTDDCKSKGYMTGGSLGDRKLHYACTCGRESQAQITGDIAFKAGQESRLPYEDATWSEEEGQCFWCKTPTHWLDFDYQGYVCSQRCQREMADDVKSKATQGEQETREALARGEGITFPNAQEAVKWLTEGQDPDKLREKIANKIPKACSDSQPACKFYEYSKCSKYDEIVCRYQLEIADQILALTGNVREQERGNILSQCSLDHQGVCLDGGIELVREQERERTIELLQDLLESSKAVTASVIKVKMSNVLQALKEEG